MQVLYFPTGYCTTGNVKILCDYWPPNLSNSSYIMHCGAKINVAKLHTNIHAMPKYGVLMCAYLIHGDSIADRQVPQRSVYEVRENGGRRRGRDGGREGGSKMQQDLAQ